MAENKIELKSINDLQDMSFYIPSYQRGYRWTQQQVKDLLNDVYEFNGEGFYCIQPLVVKKREEDIFNKIKNDATNLEDVQRLLKGSWEVIDGQQRLTTIFIILSCLGKSEFYHIEYETRPNSQIFLNSIDASKKNENIDYYHIYQAKETIEQWLEWATKEKNEFQPTEYAEKLIERVKFIWYESVEENPIMVFTRLNIGKIGLTNSELIKALMLNRSNFGADDFNSTRLKQQEIALEWDTIEYTLQQDQFWLFLNDNNDKNESEKPTRIDMIFDLMNELDLLELKTSDKEKIESFLGTDTYKTFRYFYWFFCQRQGKIQDCWEKIKNIFNTFQEWYNDAELYHYIGFLIACNVTVKHLYKNWLNPLMLKDEFISFLKDEIKKKIASCRNLEQQYEVSGCPKQVCRPLLLLHNIQTAINQSKISQEKYKQNVFYKFPFHLYKIEKWDVEHVDSNTTNLLDNKNDQKEWLIYSLLHPAIREDKSLMAEIIEFLKDECKYDFDSLAGKIKIKAEEEKEDALSETEKNQIWNFVLLDSSTNRGYGNAIFPSKRSCIIGKDQGIKYNVKKTEITKEGEIKIPQVKNDSSFIPICTKYAFLKYYNSASSSINYWNRSDAEAYKENIATILQEFINQ